MFDDDDDDDDDDDNDDDDDDDDYDVSRVWRYLSLGLLEGLSVIIF